MNIGISYKVGDAATPLFPHPSFKEPEAAMEEAVLESDEKSVVVAIWEINSVTDEISIACLVFQGAVWVKAQ